MCVPAPPLPPIAPSATSSETLIMHAPQPSEQGFTLIETMIALAIFAIGSMGILAIRDTKRRSKYLGKWAMACDRESRSRGCWRMPLRS